MFSVVLFIVFCSLWSDFVTAFILFPTEIFVRFDSFMELIKMNRMRCVKLKSKIYSSVHLFIVCSCSLG